MHFVVQKAQAGADGTPTVILVCPLYVIAHLNDLTAADLSLRVEGADGSLVQAFTGDAGFTQDGLLVWTLSPEKLPSPTQLALVAQKERIPLGQPFDPMALRGQLLDADLQGSTDTWDHRPDTTADTSGSDSTGSEAAGSDPPASNDPTPTETGN
jgi:hypothetical protein